MELIERWLGTPVGVHIGDTRGAPYEKMFSAKEITEDIARRGNTDMFDYRNPWPKDDNGEMLPAGRPTDDSDQTADLAHSIIVSGGLDTTHLRQSLRESVIDGKSRLWTGRATGAGGTTKKALSDDPKEVEEGLSNNIGTNGSLMRAAPMALWLARSIMTIADGRTFNKQNVARAKQLVYDMSGVTHAHPHSKQACWIYTMVLSSLLTGNEPVIALGDIDDIDPSVKKDPFTIGLGAHLRDPHAFPYDPGAWPARGSAEFSLYVALYTLMHTKSFEEGIEFAIGIGGDTDTYGAIAGGLLGAHYGYNAIPQKWRETILGHNTMMAYAQALYSMSFPE